MQRIFNCWGGRHNPDHDLHSCSSQGVCYVVTYPLFLFYFVLPILKWFNIYLFFFYFFIIYLEFLLSCVINLNLVFQFFFFLGNLKGSGWQLDRNAELPTASVDPAAAATLVVATRTQLFVLKRDEGMKLVICLN